MVILLFQEGTWTRLELYVDNIYYYVRFGEKQSTILKVITWKTNGNKSTRWEAGKW